MNQKDLVTKLEGLSEQAENLRQSSVKEVDDDIRSLVESMDDLIGDLEDNPLELPEKEEDGE